MTCSSDQGLAAHLRLLRYLTKVDANDVHPRNFNLFGRGACASVVSCAGEDDPDPCP